MGEVKVDKLWAAMSDLADKANHCVEEERACTYEAQADGWGEPDLKDIKRRYRACVHGHNVLEARYDKMKGLEMNQSA